MCSNNIPDFNTECDKQPSKTNGKQKFSKAELEQAIKGKREIIKSKKIVKK